MLIVFILRTLRQVVRVASVQVFDEIARDRYVTVEQFSFFVYILQFTFNSFFVSFRKHVLGNANNDDDSPHSTTTTTNSGEGKQFFKEQSSPVDATRFTAQVAIMSSV